MGLAHLHVCVKGIIKRLSLRKRAGHQQGYLLIFHERIMRAHKPALYEQFHLGAEIAAAQRAGIYKDITRIQDLVVYALDVVLAVIGALVVKGALHAAKARASNIQLGKVHYFHGSLEGGGKTLYHRADITSGGNVCHNGHLFPVQCHRGLGRLWNVRPGLLLKRIVFPIYGVLLLNGR